MDWPTNPVTLDKVRGFMLKKEYTPQIDSLNFLYSLDKTARPEGDIIL